MEVAASASATRLIVKNLPKSFDDGKLSSHFSIRGGKITDARVVKTKSGKARSFGFVGFANEAEAQDALNYFNNTFINTSKISVELARPRNDASLTRSWSRHTQPSLGAARNGSSTMQHSREATHNDVRPESILNGRSKIEKKGSMDQKKEDFMAAMKPRSSAKFWTNDELNGTEMDVAEAPARSSEVSTEENSGDDERISDLDWLRTKQANISKPASMEPNNEGSSEPIPEADADASKVYSDKRLFVRNLSYSCTKEDLELLFTRFGPVKNVHLVADKSNASKGIAFVEFERAESAADAIGALDGSIFQGRLIHLLKAFRHPSKLKSANDDSETMFKARKELERKAKADTAVGWNASHLRSDAVVDAIAERMGIEKGEFLSGEADNVAVRLAIGETQLILENKEYFRKEGIDLDVLVGDASDGRKIQRSDRIVLVKNLPYSSQKEDLYRLFSSVDFGVSAADEPLRPVVRVLLPPSRSVALVEFKSSSDARVAFKKLAYKRYQHVPLYLEWAPEAAINHRAETKNNTEAEAPLEEQTQQSLPDEGAEEACTLYVKNLAWGTDEKRLRWFFEKAGGEIRAVSIPKKKVVNKVTKEATLHSAGYGFVEYGDVSSATAAIAKLNGTVLDGHALEIKYSNKRLSANERALDAPAQAVSLEGDRVRARTKLLVKNVGFQVSTRELRELFSNYGLVKTVKMPKKFDGSHRGFAFVDFATAKEAQNAFTTLGRTHLYGRHLVLEWAKEDETLEELRAKARDYLQSSSSRGLAAPKKKIRFDDGSMPAQPRI